MLEGLLAADARGNRFLYDLVAESHFFVIAGKNGGFRILGVISNPRGRHVGIWILACDPLVTDAESIRFHLRFVIRILAHQASLDVVGNMLCLQNFRASGKIQKQILSISFHSEFILRRYKTLDGRVSAHFDQGQLGVQDEVEVREVVELHPILDSF